MCPQVGSRLMGKRHIKYVCMLKRLKLGVVLDMGCYRLLLESREQNSLGQELPCALDCQFVL
jgi:hypothetical protein